MTKKRRSKGRLRELEPPFYEKHKPPAQTRKELPRGPYAPATITPITPNSSDRGSDEE